MRTSRPFSTISYNTEEFLIAKLNTLITRHVIDFYAFVKHYKEDDEKKDHIHLFVIPNGLIDTNQFNDEMQELQTNENGEPTKPLACKPCQSSKFADWYLYSKHDANYLASKGQSRKYQYEQKEFVSSDDDYLNELSHTIDYSKFTKYAQIVEYANQGLTFEEVLRLGAVPIHQIYQYEKLYKYLQNGISTIRNGKPNHENESEDPNEEI